MLYDIYFFGWNNNPKKAYVWLIFCGVFIFVFCTTFAWFCYHFPYLAGASAWQPLPFSLIGGSSDVIQSQQQCVEFTVPHRAYCRYHTYVLTCVICPRQGVAWKKAFSQKMKDALALTTPVMRVFLTFSFQTCSTTGSHQVTVYWDIPQVWCRGPERQMWLQWSTARRTRGATLTEVRYAVMFV